MTTTGPVTVVVPVYDGVDDTVACLTSIVRHTPARVADRPVELLVIDDASPDPAMAGALADVLATATDLAAQLRTHDGNRGFVASVNEAFAATTGDVVLVNADTVVTDGWLDRLAATAVGPDVATVTPLTNSGSICTLPDAVIEAFDLDGPEPRIDDCGQFVAANGAGAAPAVITGVGFCLYVTRVALDLVGSFDEEAYGRGYGEEVDFCVRATRLGLRHLVEDRTFVWHRGGGSFGDGRHERMHQASTFLRKRFRFFRDVNRAERAHDPLRVSFTALEQALHPPDPGRQVVLHLLHGPLHDVGGTEKHLSGLLDALADDGVDAVLLYPVESGFVAEVRARAEDGTRVDERHLLPGSVRWVTAVDDPVAGEALATTLDLFPVDAVHIHSLNGFSTAVLDVLRHVDVPVVSFVHDPFLACPHYSLLYRNRAACGIPDDLAVCGRCLPETEALPIEHLRSFRDAVEGRRDAVDRWVFASRAAADHLLRVYPLDPARTSIIEHSPTVADRRRPIDHHRIHDEPLRLAFVGRGWTKKGLAHANRLADAVAADGIEVHHFGPLAEAPAASLRTHGSYDSALLGTLLDLAGISVVLLPGPTPETYGLVMTEAVIAGRPVIGAVYGALGERIRRDGVGWTFDPDDPDELIELVRRLDADRHEVVRAAEATLGVRFPTTADLAAAYAACYRGEDPELVPPPPAPPDRPEDDR